MKRKNKYQYERVMQGNYGYGWDDELFADCDSSGFITDKEERKSFKEDLRLYRENGGGAYRVITRRTLI